MISKFIPLLILPLGLAVLLGLIAIVLLFWGWRRTSIGVLLCQILLIFVTSNPIVSSVLVANLERTYPPVTLADCPNADAIVVLGGIIGAAQPPRLDIDLGAAADRLRYTAQLYHAGKAEHIIASGGNLPWLEGELPETLLMREVLMEWGVPAEAIITEQASRNTFENATGTAALMRQHGFEKVLLVTSALHMPRALAVFQSQGIDVIPAPTDILAVERGQITPMDFLPDAEALLMTTAALREHLGFLYYRLRGWIQ